MADAVRLGVSPVEGRDHQMIQDNERDALCRMFCAFCRRTLLNARTDVLRSKSRSARRELPFSQMPESELRRLAAPWEGMEPEVVFSANGHLIGVADECVAAALAGLPERERSIVLLAYWAGWSDRMIAEDMGCPRSTVQFRRTRALAALRDALGGEGDA